MPNRLFGGAWEKKIKKRRGKVCPARTRAPRGPDARRARGLGKERFLRVRHDVAPRGPLCVLFPHAVRRLVV